MQSDGNTTTGGGGRSRNGNGNDMWRGHVEEAVKGIRGLIAGFTDKFKLLFKFIQELAERTTRNEERIKSNKEAIEKMATTERVDGLKAALDEFKIDMKKQTRRDAVIAGGGTGATITGGGFILYKILEALGML